MLCKKKYVYMTTSNGYKDETNFINSGNTSSDIDC